MVYGVFTRMKRVSEPLDDKAKARIIGCNTINDVPRPCYASSGSEHSADHSDVVSPTFTDLFLDGHDDNCGASSPENDETNSEQVDECGEANVELIKKIVEDERDEFKKVLFAHVSKAVVLYSCVESNRQIMGRNVMAFLRERGYNAAICKTKWESSRGLTAGNYEFIDVLRPDMNSARYFVDLDLASELEIVRPMSSYERLLRHIPRVFVGKSQDLKQILKIASGAGMRSMKSRGLPLPPWRKRRFMENKWLAPYRRTTNLYNPTSFSSSSVNCRRTVGFECDATVNGGHLLIPISTPTR